jgi:hypothetical protein
MGRSHAGFSTVEVLVALIVFDVGLLGAVTTTALTSRLLIEARNRSRVTLAASERIELVRNVAAVSGGCAALSGGSRPLGGGLGEQWTLTGTGGTRPLQVIITSPTHRGIRADTIRTVISCA